MLEDVDCNANQKEVIWDVYVQCRVLLLTISKKERREILIHLVNTMSDVEKTIDSTTLTDTS